MNKFFNKKVNTILSVLLIIISLFIVLQTAFSSTTLNAGESSADVVQQTICSDRAVEAMAQDAIILTTTEPVETQKPTKAVKPTKSVEPTTVEPTTVEPTVAFATAVPPKNPVDYNAQWEAGYLVAIDNPDTTYKCAQVTLSEHDRDLLERLCMGEFGSGGFVGASLIAQAVKNAICFDGYRSVAQVIKECRYTGSTDCVANEDCKKAVRYIFDENHDAVQHRIMYMYNPDLVQSAFHESQNYILTYENVRFFDRWGY